MEVIEPKVEVLASSAVDDDANAHFRPISVSFLRCFRENVVNFRRVDCLLRRRVNRKQ